MRSWNVTEQALAEDIEVKIVRAGIDAMTYVLDFLGEPVEILVHVLRKLEYQNVKTIIRGLHGGSIEGMRLWDLGKYAGIRLTDVKDYEKALRASPYSWILPRMQETPIAQIENALDLDYYAKFLDLAHRLPDPGPHGCFAAGDHGGGAGERDLGPSAAVLLRHG